MREYNLKKLGLDLTATDKDIKSAYRELSKKYHPDLNPSSDAKEQFIKVKDAYEYLTDDSPIERNFTNHKEEVSEVEKWRAEARKRAKEKATAQKMYQQELVIKVNKYFKPVAMVILIFNSLLTFDYFLPYKDHDQKIIGMKRIYESSGSRYGGRGKHRYDEMHFEDFVMRFNKNEVISIRHYESATVQATPIFSRPMVALITTDGKQEQHEQIYNIYNIFGYLIPIMLLLSILFFALKKPMHKLNMAIILSMFFLYQLFLFNQSVIV